MNPELLTPIVAAIIAGSAALGGVIISQAISILLSFLDKRHKKHILLRQKYEEMMLHFSDSLAWLQDLHCCKTRHELFAQAQSPHARKALSLCLLYFPDLANTANQYIVAQYEYYAFAASSFDENLEINVGGQTLVHDHGKTLADNLMKNKIIFENQIVNTSRKYIRA